MIDWNFVAQIALGVLLGVLAVYVLCGVVMLLGALLLNAYYFVFIEWPDSIKWWWRNRGQ